MQTKVAAPVPHAIVVASGHRFAINIFIDKAAGGKQVMHSAIEPTRALASAWVEATLALMKIHPAFCAPDFQTRARLR